MERRRQRVIDHQRESLQRVDLTGRSPKPLPASKKEEERRFLESFSWSAGRARR